VRHKGFIPWDDDIDVAMPRPDYDKFLKVAQNELPEYVFVQTNATDKEYPLSFAKLRNSNTTFVEKSIKNLNINHGIYIDVFPLDGYPNNIIKKYIFIFKKYIYSFRISYLFNLSKAKRKITAKYLIKKLMKGLSKVLCKDVKTAVQKRDKLYRQYSYETSALIANNASPWEQKEVMPREYYGEGVEGVFEGISVKLPENYDAYLSSVYGDYMKLPPVEKREGHHYYENLDINKSYREYLKV
jgi:lipopolysaccharide cholinephosphotransferase